MLLRYSIGDSWHDMIFKTKYLFSEGSPHVHVNFKIGYFLFSKQSFFGRKKIRWDSGGIPLRVTLSPAFLRLKSKAGYRWWFPEEIFLTLLILLIVTILLVNWYYWYWHCWYNILPSVMHIAYAYVMHDWRTRLEICDCGVDKSLNPICSL